MSEDFPALLEVNELSAFYDKFQAVNKVSLEVRCGEAVGILGPNGHGKTTIVKAISGLITSISGGIKFEGENINGLSPDKIVERGIIQVPQGSRLFPKMTVMENLLLGAYTPHSWKEREETLNKVFEVFPQLIDKKNRKASTLSGGERHMVAVGRGLMSSAKLLMLDEPFMGLAPLTSRDLMKKIIEIRKRGMSLLIVEERATYIRELADRIYLVENGRTVFNAEKAVFFENTHVKEAYLGVC